MVKRGAWFIARAVGPILSTVACAALAGVVAAGGGSPCQSGPGLFGYGPHRDDPEAEQLAMHLTGELRAPDAEYERILRDLALIRATWPVLGAVVDDPDYAPAELLVNIDPGQPLTGYVELSQYFQVIDDAILVNTIHHLTFCDNLNAPVLSQVWADLPEVPWAEPNSFFGTDDRITIQALGTTYRYEIDDGFLDCFDGCDCFRFWIVDVTEDGTVSLVSYSQAGQSWCEFANTACCLNGACQLRPIAACLGQGGTPLAFGASCAGGDADGDGFNTACGDNCPLTPNPSQSDGDTDGRGDVCDNCPLASNPGQEDADADDVGAACDNCPDAANPGQADLDLDLHGDACDNCPLESNPSQSDADADAEGDRCDLTDGLIYVVFDTPPFVDWQAEAGYDAWNLYRGSLAVLLDAGLYTQAPGSNPLAARTCGLGGPGLLDPLVPDPGQAAFYLPTGVSARGESGLGEDSAGQPRPNSHPCP